LSAPAGGGAMAQAWEPFAAAAFAPAAVWLLWRAQALSVELLRWRLVALARWRGARGLYAVVSWFGTFLHEVSHASVLLLSGHGSDLASLDLARWPHLGVFLLVLLAMPASRPSHVKGSRFHGSKSEGDIPVLRQRIRQQPLLFVAFLALLYGAHFLIGALPGA